jgi:hypothetical protein
MIQYVLSVAEMAAENFPLDDPFLLGIEMDRHAFKVLYALWTVKLAAVAQLKAGLC